ncbi:MAG: DUF1629 domain-containing protein [Acinetobacter calcoaceticus]
MYYTRGTIRDISVLKKIKLTKGEPISDKNIKIEIDLIEEYEPADYFHVGSLFIVSSKLKDILERKQVSAEYFSIKLYKPNGIPIQTKYFFVNLLKKIDCINKEHSRYTQEKGFIDEIYKLVVDVDKAENEVLFRIDKIFNNIILVHDSLIYLIKSLGCTGVNFINIDDWKW